MPTGKNTKLVAAYVHVEDFAVIQRLAKKGGVSEWLRNLVIAELERVEPKKP
jgi:hypothetical protein